MSEAELPTLMPEVRDFEPRLALVGERSGELAAAARGVLAPGGALVLESHAELARGVAVLLTELGFEEAKDSVVDLAGRERVVEARWRQQT